MEKVTEKIKKPSDWFVKLRNFILIIYSLFLGLFMYYVPESTSPFSKFMKSLDKNIGNYYKILM